MDGKVADVVMVFIALVLLASPAQANKKVIFYEINTPQNYVQKGGFSGFTNRLREDGYEIASISKGSLTRESLSSYDILIITPSTQLKIDEISSILWFVTTKGGGVLILGSTAATANQLMIPFGMTMDDGILVDSTDTIANMDSTNFIIRRFSDSETTRIIRAGVAQVGFYRGSGMFLSGSAECIATGDSDTYSETQSFQTGSFPCIASATLFGRGLVFGLTDADVLTNQYFGSYDNKKFAKNIIDWLSITVPPQEGNFTYEECQVMIGQLKLEKLRIEQEKENTQSTLDRLQKDKAATDSKLVTVSAELEEIKRGKIGPFTRNQWAIIIAGVLFLVAAVVLSKRGKAPKKKEEDILGELGYEFEYDKSKKPQGAGEEIDIAALDKELGEL